MKKYDWCALQKLFPCATGHSKLADKNCSSRHSQYFSACKIDKIKFYNNCADNPELFCQQFSDIIILIQ